MFEYIQLLKSVLVLNNNNQLLDIFFLVFEYILLLKSVLVLNNNQLFFGVSALDENFRMSKNISLICYFGAKNEHFIV